MPPPWLFDVAQELAEQKRRHPDDSLRSLVVHDQILGPSAMNINMCFVVFAVAGHETTRSRAAHFVGLMQDHPDRFALLRSDLDAHLENAIEEVMRFTSTTTSFRRTAT
jgi:cytochrome P450